MNERNVVQRAVDARSFLVDQANENPIRTILVALGAGFIVGGGLTSPLTGRILKIGLRFVSVPLLAQVVGGMARGQSFDSDRNDQKQEHEQKAG
ncbi:MAG: hypothetical protein SGI86_19220 [Deltaproteobacteria bacterium]|nr:hypothetical protein [Deltaproteobacteria bacterium]